MREIFNLSPNTNTAPSQLAQDRRIFASPCSCNEKLIVNDCITGLCAELDENQEIIFRLPYDVAGKRLRINNNLCFDENNNQVPCYDYSLYSTIFGNPQKDSILRIFTGSYLSEILPRTSGQKNTDFYDVHANYLYPSGYTSIGKKAPCILELKLDGFSNHINNNRCNDCSEINGTYYAYASNLDSGKDKYKFQFKSNQTVANPPLPNIDLYSTQQKNSVSKAWSLFGDENKYHGGEWTVNLCDKNNPFKFACGLASNQNLYEDTGISLSLSYEVKNLGNLNLNQYINKYAENLSDYYNSIPFTNLLPSKSGTAEIYLNAFLIAMNPYSGCGIKTVNHYRAKVGEGIFIGSSGAMGEYCDNINYIKSGQVEQNLIHYSGLVVNSNVKCTEWNDLELNYYRTKIIKKCPTIRTGTSMAKLFDPVDSTYRDVSSDYGKTGCKRTTKCAQFSNDYEIILNPNYLVDIYHISGIITARDEEFITNNPELIPWCNLGTVKVSSKNTSYSNTSITNESGIGDLKGYQNNGIFTKDSTISNYNNSVIPTSDVISASDIALEKVNHHYHPRLLNIKGNVDLYKIPDYISVSFNDIKNAISGCKDCERLNYPSNFILSKRNNTTWTRTLTNFFKKEYQICQHKKTDFTNYSSSSNKHYRCYDNFFANLSLEIIPSGEKKYVSLNLTNDFYNRNIETDKFSVGSLPPTLIARWSSLENSLNSNNFILNINGSGTWGLQYAGSSGLCNFEGSTATIEPYITSTASSNCMTPVEQFNKYNDDNCEVPNYFMLDIDDMILADKRFASNPDNVYLENSRFYCHGCTNGGFYWMPIISCDSLGAKCASGVYCKTEQVEGPYLLRLIDSSRDGNKKIANYEWITTKECGINKNNYNFYSPLFGSGDCIGQYWPGKINLNVTKLDCQKTKFQFKLTTHCPTEQGLNKYSTFSPKNNIYPNKISDNCYHPLIKDQYLEIEFTNLDYTKCFMKPDDVLTFCPPSGSDCFIGNLGGGVTEWKCSPNWYTNNNACFRLTPVWE